MKEKLLRIYNLLNELYQEGYVPSGQIELVKPKTPGLIDLKIELNPDLGYLKILTTKKPLVHLKVDTSNHASATTELQALAKSQGFTGNTCVHCGLAMMVRQGTCEKCMNCGETSGCS